MPLVLGFAGLLAMVLLLDHALSGASYADILHGKSGDAFKASVVTHNTASSSTAPGDAATGIAGVANSTVNTVAPKGNAVQILNRLLGRNVKVDKTAYGALSQGRLDQGLDFGGAGPVKAIADGVVKSVGLWHGWPGTGGIVYETALGPVYVMEDFAPGVKVGQRVRAGQIIGHATGGHSGIETGLASSDLAGPLVRYNGDADGTPEPGGQAFAALLGLLHLDTRPH